MVVIKYDIEITLLDIPRMQKRNNHTFLTFQS